MDGPCGDVFPCCSVLVCGRPTGQGVAFVRNGQNVSSTADFPWHVAVYDKTIEKPAQICGGSLIKPKYFVSGKQQATQKNQHP